MSSARGRPRRSNDGGTATIADLLELYRARVTARADITEATRTRTLNNVGYITKTWPGVGLLRPDQVTRGEIEKWRDRAMTIGTGFKPPGAKRVSATFGKSASSFNKAVDAMRRMLDMAVDAGTIHNNPLQGRQGLKAKLAPKKPNLSEAAKLREIFAEIESSGERGGWAIETADFCRFLNVTGCRVGEARAIRVRHVDLIRGIIQVP